MSLPTNYVALLQTAAADGGPSSLMTFAPIVILVLLFYFLIIRPQNKTRRQLEEKISKLKSGDEVLLTSGLYATVDRVDGYMLYLKIGNNVVKARRNAVAALASEVDNPTKKTGIFS